MRQTGQQTPNPKPKKSLLGWFSFSSEEENKNKLPSEEGSDTSNAGDLATSISDDSDTSSTTNSTDSSTQNGEHSSSFVGSLWDSAAQKIESVKTFTDQKTADFRKSKTNLFTLNPILHEILNENKSENLTLNKAKEVLEEKTTDEEKLNSDYSTAHCLLREILGDDIDFSRDTTLALFNKCSKETRKPFLVYIKNRKKQVTETIKGKCFDKEPNPSFHDFQKEFNANFKPWVMYKINPAKEDKISIVDDKHWKSVLDILISIEKAQFEEAAKKIGVIKSKRIRTLLNKLKESQIVEKIDNKILELQKNGKITKETERKSDEEIQELFDYQSDKIDTTLIKSRLSFFFDKEHLIQLLKDKETTELSPSISEEIQNNQANQEEFRKIVAILSGGKSGFDELNSSILKIAEGELKQALTKKAGDLKKEVEKEIERKILELTRNLDISDEGIVFKTDENTTIQLKESEKILSAITPKEIKIFAEEEVKALANYRWNEIEKVIKNTNASTTPDTLEKSVEESRNRAISAFINEAFKKHILDTKFETEKSVFNLKVEQLAATSFDDFYDLFFEKYEKNLKPLGLNLEAKKEAKEKIRNLIIGFDAVKEFFQRFQEFYGNNKAEIFPEEIIKKIPEGSIRDHLSKINEERIKKIEEEVQKIVDSPDDYSSQFFEVLYETFSKKKMLLQENVLREKLKEKIGTAFKNELNERLKEILKSVSHKDGKIEFMNFDFSALESLKKELFAKWKSASEEEKERWIAESPYYSLAEKMLNNPYIEIDIEKDITESKMSDTTKDHLSRVIKEKNELIREKTKEETHFSEGIDKFLIKLLEEKEILYNFNTTVDHSCEKAKKEYNRLNFNDLKKILQENQTFKEIRGVIINNTGLNTIKNEEILKKMEFAYKNFFSRHIGVEGDISIRPGGHKKDREQFIIEKIEKKLKEICPLLSQTTTDEENNIKPTKTHTSTATENSFTSDKNLSTKTPLKEVEENHQSSPSLTSFFSAFAEFCASLFPSIFNFLIEQKKDFSTYFTLNGLFKLPEQYKEMQEMTSNNESLRSADNLPTHPPNSKAS